MDCCGIRCGQGRRGEVGSTISGQDILFLSLAKRGMRDGSAESGQSGSHALIYGGTAPESQGDAAVYECKSKSARVPRAVFVIIQRKKMIMAEIDAGRRFLARSS
jgi:hypothetical protein